MTIPDYQTLMLPLLKIAADKKEHSKEDAMNILAEQFRLTEAEKKVLLYGNKQGLFNKRVALARTILQKAGLITSTRWGNILITERGLELLKTNPGQLNDSLLRRYVAV